ncbi:glutamate decarboxylase [Myceligenerans xiligouense]|uniref:Glutamate decarboxylase n=1 Tax=Myceligenerans xiligouense TaxID=253184 RepID=A0A3N4YSD0_9MICO|nr:glutamate decarboxylase [Myceligenerans xiligouense]RPF22294.1 glutamate decarboxylase [Myceligenerans xiligouense]
MSSRPRDIELNPIFARPGETTSAPRDRFPGGPMLPETAYQLVHDDAMLDGNARLNLATFVSTWMDEHADKLYAAAYDKNMIDKDEYPATAAIETYCWKMLADLWHAPDPDRAVGCSTTGSSEACMLAGLALKRRWAERRRDAGLPAERPNLVLSSAVQVCWEKFCNFFEVEPRYVPISDGHPTLDGDTVRDHVDENTIGVVAIMGVTYTGMYEPVARIAAALDVLASETGVDVPIHVDGASGAMIAPFVQPDLAWDFRVERVASISTSGHKYGLVYPGVGWVAWRDAGLLPESLVFRVSYLGGDMPTFALNFSRPGAQVLLQYYTFLRHGVSGFTDIQSATLDVARHLAREIGGAGPFEPWNETLDLPVLAWRLRPADDGGARPWTLYDLSDRLRMHGWQVPAYPLPANLEDVTVQRVVVRNGLGMDLADRLLDDLRTAAAHLESTPPSRPTTDRDRASAFHH